MSAKVKIAIISFSCGAILVAILSMFSIVYVQQDLDERFMQALASYLKVWDELGPEAAKKELTFGANFSATLVTRDLNELFSLGCSEETKSRIEYSKKYLEKDKVPECP